VVTLIDFLLSEAMARTVSFHQENRHGPNPVPIYGARFGRHLLAVTRLTGLRAAGCGLRV
jgi:hypothetical protein